MTEITGNKRFSLKSINFLSFRELGLLSFMIIFSIIIQMQNSKFFTFENITDMLKNTAILSILSIGMMLVIITRGIDLSIGATLALSGMTSALIVAANPGMNPIIPIIIGMLVGFLCGSLVGILVSKAGVLPIIASLGMMNVFRGLTYIESRGKWVSANQMSSSFKKISSGSVFGINTLIVLAFIIFIIAYYFIKHTRTGRQIYAVGSNPDSAKISGINSDKIIWLVYALMGTLAGLAGVLWVSKFASAQGDTANGYELTVIAACVLGGVNITGGSGRISGIILGSLLIGILNNSLPLMNVSSFWQDAIHGLIIIFAVIANILVKQRIEKNNIMRRVI